MEKVYISWNPVNWLTVIAMAGLGWALFGFASQAYKAWFGNGLTR